VKRALQSQSPADRHSRTTKLIAARQDVVTKSCRVKPTAPASPWQNSFAERLIGSIRRECVDHIIVLGEMHLRRVLKSEVRTHQGRFCFGKTPMQTFVDATPLAREKSFLNHAPQNQANA
jgi:Integrase core domain